jgi:hypothetical protein
MIFLLSGCATNNITNHSYEYKKIEIANNSIKKTIEPGMNIFVETMDLVSRCIVSGYEGDETLLCVDEYDINKKTDKILIKNIENIRVKVINGIPVKEDTKIEEWNKIATYAYETGYIYEKLEISSFSTKNNSTKYTIEDSIKPGMIIYAETKEVYGRFKVIRFESNGIMVVEDENNKQTLNIPINDIEQLRIREADVNQNNIPDNSEPDPVGVFMRQMLNGFAKFVVMIAFIGILALVL